MQEEGKEIREIELTTNKENAELAKVELFNEISGIMHNPLKGEVESVDDIIDLCANFEDPTDPDSATYQEDNQVG